MGGAAFRRRGVDAVLEYPQPGPALLTSRAESHEVGHGSAEPVEVGSDELITRTVCGGEGFVELGATGPRPARAVDVDVVGFDTSAASNPNCLWLSNAT